MIKLKTITIVVPTYNEEDNIFEIIDRVDKVFSSSENLCNSYDYEIQFIDNASKDKTRTIIEEVAKDNRHIKAIFNAANYGFSRSCFYGLSQAQGDCAVLMFADMQDPPEVIPHMVEAWEKGAEVVVGRKTKSRESILKYIARGIYYKIINSISDTEQIEQFDGFGLYDKSFIQNMRLINDTIPYLRGLVTELVSEYAVVEYTQDVRKKGKSKFSFMKCYDTAMLGLTSTSKLLMRIASFIGVFLGILSIIIALITLVIKLMKWDYFNAGAAAIIVGIFFLGAIQLFFLGVLGEYICNINIRTMQHPIIIERKRINMGMLVDNEESKTDE